MIKVAVSGYFTALHEGHIEMFREAKALGDKLIVIINNNEQQVMKYGRVVHDVKSIKKVVESIKYVDDVFISIDKDRTVCETLRCVYPDIFANGGDRNKKNVPENYVCKNLGIKQVFGVGGSKKLQHSSKIIGEK
jgi:cytidyltransferase-like protein